MSTYLASPDIPYVLEFPDDGVAAVDRAARAALVNGDVVVSADDHQTFSLVIHFGRIRSYELVQERPEANDGEERPDLWTTSVADLFGQ